MTRAHRRTPWITLCARLTLAAFAAALPGTAAWAQPVVERVAPAAMPAAFFSGALAAPSIFTPSVFSVAPALSPALLAAPPLSAASLPSDVPAAAAPAADAPAAGATLRSMSEQAAASDGQAPSAAAFDGANNEPAVFAMDHSRGIQALSQGEKNEAYDRMEQAGQHPYWVGQNLFVYGEPAAIAHTAGILLSARGWTLSRHDPISGAASPAATKDESPAFRGPSGRTYRLVPGSDDVARDEKGNFYRVSLNERGALSVEPLNPPAPAKPADPKEPSGLTDALLAHLVGTLHHVDKNFVEKISPEKWRALIDKGLTAMLAGLEDPHTMYYDKAAWDKYRHDAEGNFTGIGVVMDTDREQAVFMKAFDEAMEAAGRPTDDAVQHEIGKKIRFAVHADGALLKGVRPDSPAAKAGLRKGDVVVAVDGFAIGGQKWDDVSPKIQGPSGSVVKIGFIRDGAPGEVVVTRGEIPVPLLSTRLVAPGVGYLHMREFRANTVDEVVQAMRDLQAQGARKMILDLRGNPGGNMTTAHNILANLLPAGALISSTMHRGELATKAHAEDAGPFAEMEKIVLVDGHSASASELTAATLQDYGVTVVGPSNSYGKFSFQYVMHLPQEKSIAEADAGMRITAGRYYSGKGRSFPAQHDPKTQAYIPGTGGVTPDVIVPMTKEQELNLHISLNKRLYGEEQSVADPVLDKAVAILNARP